MSKDNTYNILLQKLIDGSITKQELWQLEKASLDDPFLADALEGYYDQKAKAEHITELKSTINKSQKTKTRSLFFRLSTIAASLALLLSVSFWLLDQSAGSTMVSESKTESAGGSVDKSKDIVVGHEQPVEIAAGKTMKTSKTESSPTESSYQNKAQPEIAEVLSKSVSKKEATTAVPQPKEIVQVDVAQQGPAGPMGPGNGIIKENLAEEKIDVNESTDDIVANDNNTSLTEEEALDLTAYKKTAIDYTTPHSKAKSSKSHDKVRKESVKEAEEVVIQKSADLADMPVSQSSGVPLDHLANSAPIFMPPAIIKGVVKSDKGLPLPGVEIRDSKNNPIAMTDANGQFHLPEGQAYIITSFSGYDPMTVAVTENLSIELQPSAEKLSEPHQRLIDQMDDTEVGYYYTNKLNALFSQHWPLCNQANSMQGDFMTNAGRPSQQRVRNNISVVVKINAAGQVDDLTLFEEIDERCYNKITSVFNEAVSAGIFERGRPVEFRYRINL